MPHTITKTFHRPINTGLLRRAIATLLTWTARSKDRARLAGLDPHLLRDIGLDCSTIAKETAKPFWRG